MTDDLTAQEPWHETAFGPLTAAFWRALADPQTIERDVDFIVDRLDLARGSRVLDLACGDGRHAHAMARRGYAVVGLDSSAAMLALALEQESGARFVQADVRELGSVRRCDPVGKRVWLSGAR